MKKLIEWIIGLFILLLLLGSIGSILLFGIAILVFVIVSRLIVNLGRRIK